MEPITGNVFAAECIRKSRTRKGKVEYLIKWKGWSSKWDSWEPADNILDNRLIQDFDRRQERLFQRKIPKKSSKSNKTSDKKKSAASKASSNSASSSTNRASSDPIAPLRIKISGLENEEDQTTSHEESDSDSSSVASSSAVSSPNAPPKLSPQGPLSADSIGLPVNGLPSSGVSWSENDSAVVVGGPPEKRAKVKRVDCTDEFSFTNRTLTDVRVNETTVTFVEL